METKFSKFLINEKFSIKKYNSFSELTNKDLFDIARCGLEGEFEFSAVWDEFSEEESGKRKHSKDVLNSASEYIVNDDFKYFLEQIFPVGFDKIPKIVPIYRFVSLIDVTGLNRKNLGKSWFANIDLNHDFFDQLDHLLPRHRPNDHKLYLISAKINENNIDIPRTLWLRSCNYSENEIRLKDDKNGIEIISVEKYHLYNN
jgi:hypothetical protein